MFELHTLGTLGLRSAAGTELRAVLRQPKRLALLAYLAIEAGDRWIRRDLLLALFWPELDQSHARAALRRALFFLRQSLGDGTIEGRGDEELRILPGSLWCDAHEFERRLDAGEPGPALALFQGALLEGFYIAGAPEAEAWLDRTRARLQQRAARAAWSLAEDPAADPALSDSWARKAAALLPDDEDSVRRLLNHLQRHDDRRGALAAFEEYARRLRLDLESEPSPDLQSLALALRRRTDPPAGETRLVRILPVEISGDPALAYLREGLISLLGSALDGIADFRVVGSEPIPAGDSAGTHTDYTIRGSLVESGGRMRLSATLECAGDILVRAAAEGTGEGALFDMVDDVVRQLLAGQKGGADQRLTLLAGRTTTSLPALRLWLEGERHFRQGQFLPALDAYQRSVSADPEFALAHYRLASAAAASALIGPARSSSALAVARATRLSERERLLVEAQEAWLHGRTDEAERRYAAVVAGYPDDFEAWYLLGDLLFHGNPYRGRSIREARLPLERALALDQSHLSTLTRLARLAALDHDWAGLDGLVTRIVRLNPSGTHTFGVVALRSTALGRDGEYRDLLARLREAPALAIAIAFSDLALYGRNPSDATHFGREMVDLFRSPELVAFGHLVLASIAVSLGDLPQAMTELSRSQELDVAWGIEIRGLLAALPFVDWPEGWLRATREMLTEWDATVCRPNISPPLAFHNGLHPHLRAYLLGLLSARMNDPAGVVQAEELLTELEVPEDGAVLVERLERSVRAELLVLRGRREEALAELAGAPADVWFQYAVASPFYGGGFERWRRGRLLLDLGQEDGRGWLEAIAERSPWELPFRRAR